MGRLTAFLTAPLAKPLRAPLRRATALIRGAIAAFNPAAQFAPALPGLWVDTSDYATQSQDSAGATPVTGVNQTVGRMLDKSGRGNTISQATAAARPLTATAGAILYHTYDGIDDGMATGAITLSADMDYFIAVRRNSAADSILSALTGNAGAFIFCMSSSAGTASASAGTPTYAANGVDVPGGTGTTRVQLQTAVTQSQWIVVEARNANFSGWTSIGISNYVSGFAFNGDVGGVILAPAGNAATRQNNRRELGAKFGLVLP